MEKKEVPEFGTKEFVYMCKIIFGGKTKKIN